MNNQFQTPILFIVFNRPISTKLVFDQIKNIKPTKLFIAADGPRPENPNDVFNCAQVRKIVEEIDWECEVFTLFRNENLGCGRAVSSAINWFFEHVEEGIILEDDCLPNESFFSFCSLMLEQYRFDKKVMMISGTNFVAGRCKRSKPYLLWGDYFFSRSYLIWGWATWKRAWSLYNYDLNDWEQHRNARINDLQIIFKNKSIEEYWIENFDKVINKKVDTWDYQWCFCCIFNGGLSISPRLNLVSNIGIIGAHSSGKSMFLCIPSKKMCFDKISVLKSIEVNKRFEFAIYKDMSVIKPIGYQLLMSFKKTVKKILNLMGIWN